jgi:hypothetical protein
MAKRDNKAAVEERQERQQEANGGQTNPEATQPGGEGAGRGGGDGATTTGDEEGVTTSGDEGEQGQSEGDSSEAAPGGDAKEFTSSAAPAREAGPAAPAPAPEARIFPPNFTASTEPPRAEREGLAAPHSPADQPTRQAQRDFEGYARAVGTRMLRDLPEGVTAEAVTEGVQKPTVKLTWDRATEGGITCLVGLAQISEDADAELALRDVRAFWGI